MVLLASCQSLSGEYSCASIIYESLLCSRTSLVEEEEEEDEILQWNHLILL